MTSLAAVGHYAVEGLWGLRTHLDLYKQERITGTYTCTQSRNQLSSRGEGQSPEIGGH